MKLKGCSLGRELVSITHRVEYLSPVVHSGLSYIKYSYLLVEWQSFFHLDSNIKILKEGKPKPGIEQISHRK